MWKMLCVAVAVLFVVSRVSHAGHVFQYHGVGKKHTYKFSIYIYLVFKPRVLITYIVTNF